MNSKRQFPITFVLTLALALALLLAAGTAGAQPQPVTMSYGDVTLTGAATSLAMPGSWNLAAGPVTVAYTLDLTGAPNVAFTRDWNAVGYVGLFWSEGASSHGARMAGFLHDSDPVAQAVFPSYPDLPDTQDLDDKFNLSRQPNPGTTSETMYDVYCATKEVAAAPFGSTSNYGIWFDRDGVDPFQATNWGVVEGATYNTGGTYDVQLVFDRAANAPARKGIVCPTFSPGVANPDVPGGTGVPTGFNRLAAGGYEIIPAGLSFDIRPPQMTNMQIYVQGGGGAGTIVVQNLTVTGHLTQRSSGGG